MDRRDFSEQFPRGSEGQDVGQDFANTSDPILKKNPLNHDIHTAKDTNGQAAPRRPRKSAKANTSGKGEASEPQPRAERTEEHDDAHEPTFTVEALEAQGFTSDEVASLMGLTVKIANSNEVREEQAIIRRLRFQRWLIEHGRLDEYAANDLPTLDSAPASEQHV